MKLGVVRNTGGPIEFPQGQGQQRMGEEIFYLDKEGKSGSRGLEALGTIRHNRWNRTNK